MSKMIIIDGNANDKDNVRAYMVKGEPGLSPVANVSKTGDTATISITDKNGTTTTTIKDGDTPTASVSKSNHVATITITDEDGTTTATVSDGADLTDGAVPTNGVIYFDGLEANIPGGYEVASNPGGKVLWSNPYPSSQFTQRSITLSSGDYDFLEWYFLDGNSTFSIRTVKGYGCFPYMLVQEGNTGYFGFRMRKVGFVDDTTFSITTGTIKYFNKTTTESDTYDTIIKPLYVVGYKL